MLNVIFRNKKKIKSHFSQQQMSLAAKLRAEKEAKHKYELDLFFAKLPELIEKNASQRVFYSVIKFLDSEFPFEWFSLRQGLYRQKLQDWSTKAGYRLKIWEFHDDKCGRQKYFEQSEFGSGAIGPIPKCVENCCSDAGVEFDFKLLPSESPESKEVHT